MNFIERLISKGFIRVTHEGDGVRQDAGFNVNNGWMGLTTYHPYEKFAKGNTVIDFSLEMYGTRVVSYTAEGIIESNDYEKKIRCFVDGVLVYENNYGVTPSDEIIKL